MAAASTARTVRKRDRCGIMCRHPTAGALFAGRGLGAASNVVISWPGKLPSGRRAVGRERANRKVSQVGVGAAWWGRGRSFAEPSRVN